MNNFEQPQNLKTEQPGIDLDEIIRNAELPSDEDIAKRQDPDEIADMSGKNILGQRDRDLINRVESDKNSAESILERIKNGFR